MSGLLLGASTLALSGGSGASSHRDAPLIAQDPVADNTDVYAFVSPDAPDTVTLISNFIPLQEPAAGPNFHNFGDDVLYEILVDNDADADVEFRYQFRFTTKVAAPAEGTDDTPLINEGPITFEDGAYKNLKVSQTYSVTEVTPYGHQEIITDAVVPPPNIGPRSTPNYPELAHAAITEGSYGIKAFAGPRDEAFPVDLGSIFDLGGLRPLNPAHLLPLDAEDGVNTTTGYNVHSISLQIPKSRIVDGDHQPIIGVHSTASRRAVTTRTPGGQMSSGDYVQVSRLGNPLVNEVVVPLSAKDTFNGAPMGASDAGFLPIVQDPRLGQLLPVLYPGAFECLPETPRDDLVAIFLTGLPGLNLIEGEVPTEQLRLNTSIAPSADPNPMGVLGGDNAGFPNGRRIGDDVVDIALQAVAGAAGDCAGVAPNNALGDGVVGNDLQFLSSFPYLAHPHQGYNHFHDHGNSPDNSDHGNSDDDDDKSGDNGDNGDDKGDKGDNKADKPYTDSRSHQVERIYLASFSRGSDAEGKTYWMQQDSVTIQQIAELFVRSQEFLNTYGELSDADFVERVYQNVLGRSSDSEGKTYWVALLEVDMTRGQMMAGFSESAEFINKQR